MYLYVLFKDIVMNWRDTHYSPMSSAKPPDFSQPQQEQSPSEKFHIQPLIFLHTLGLNGGRWLGGCEVMLIDVGCGFQSQFYRETYYIICIENIIFKLKQSFPQQRNSYGKVPFGHVTYPSTKNEWAPTKS